MKDGEQGPGQLRSGKMASKPGEGKVVTATKPGGWTLGPAASACPASTAPSQHRPELPWNRPPLTQLAQAHRHLGEGWAGPLGSTQATCHSAPTMFVPHGPAFPSGKRHRLGTCWVGGCFCGRWHHFPSWREGLPRTEASTGGGGVPCQPLSSWAQLCLQP